MLIKQITNTGIIVNLFCILEMYMFAVRCFNNTIKN